MSDSRKDDYLVKRITQLTYIARIQLIWERFAPVLALGLAFAAAFLTLSFAGVWQYLGDPWRATALLIALGFLSHAAWNAQKLELPNENEAKRRIERDSGLKHRPLDVITDKPAMNEHHDQAWASHINQARKDADRAERPIWRAVLASRDPYRLRFILPVLLIGAVIWGLGDNRERLRRAVSPTWQHGMSAKNASFEAWIDPPVYTGRPPIYFKSEQFVEIPEGSTLVTRVNGLKTVPRLKLALKGKTRYAAPNRLGPRLYETRDIITKSGKAEYRLGTHKQIWGLTVIPDRPPVISIDEPPSADKRDRLVVTYSLNDDYGAEDVQLVLQRLDSIGGISKINMPISKGQRKASNAKLSLDLTKHIWAGRKVSGYLEVIDGYGHVAVSEPAYFTIPDKIFVEPLAKAIIENRQLLLSAVETNYQSVPRLARKDIKNIPVFDQYQPDLRLERAAPQIQRAAALLDVITDKPAGYFEDPALFMGLNFIKSQIKYADEKSDIAAIPEELWKVALRAEFGTLGSALEEMREAQRALREAISRRAPQREIETLFDRYNGAVDNYLEELRRKALENPQEQDGNNGGEGGEGTNQDEIQALLKAIEEANRIGDVDGARRALAKLAELLENLEINLQLGSGGSGEPQEGEISEELQDSLEDLAELLGEQRELKSETERSEREAQRREQEGNQDGNGDEQQNDQGETGQNGQRPGRAQSADALRERQQNLSERLAELQQQIEDLGDERLGQDQDEGQSGSETGETDGTGAGDEQSDDEDGRGGGSENEESVEENLGRALEAMRESNESLGDDAFRESLQQMQQAIAALRDAGNRLAEESSGREPGEDGNEQQAENDENGDPFGREDSANGSGFDTESQVDLENANRQKRARELLEELRNRAAEEDRDKLEKDYLDRLLKQF